MLKTPGAMTRFPSMHEYLRVFCFIAQRARQTAMVFMRMGEHDAANVGDRKSGALESGAQSCRGFFGLWASVDDRDWIFGDQIDIDRPDVERRGQRDGDDFHAVRLRIWSSSFR